jgi:hypothetical protein
MTKHRKLVFKKLTVRTLTDSQAAAAVGGDDTCPETCDWRNCPTASCEDTCGSCYPTMTNCTTWYFCE